jgi:hypothetical protein
MTDPAQTRSLKKYEAAAHAISRDEAMPPMAFYSPFGPMIAKTRLPDPLLARVNAWADGVCAPDRGSEWLVPEDIAFGGGADSLAQHVAQLIRRYLAGLEGTHAEAVEFERFWVVSQYASTPSPTHFHSGDLSVVLYLKVPEIDAQEEQKTYLSGRQAGYISFLIGGKQRFSKSLISFRPEVGDFYLFPGWLLHVAEPFRGRGERRSLAFNAFVPGEDR